MPEPNVTLTDDEPDRDGKHLYAVLSQGPKGEGLVAVQTGGVWQPLVSLNQEAIKKAMPLIQRGMRQRPNERLHIYRYASRVDVTEEFLDA